MDNICIYCNQEKDHNDFSLEHIFPDSLGGKFTNNIFKTKQVCIKCNSLSGLYVDSAVVKNFFSTTSTIFSDYLGYYDFDKKPFIPFSYIGFVEEIKHPNYKFCENWLWCGGSMVYHFHNNSEDDFETIAGGDPRKRKGKNPGEAYLLGFTKSEFWAELLLKAFEKQFKKSKRILVNYIIQNNDNIVNKEQQEIKEILFNIHKKQTMLKRSMPIKPDFNIRFQAKLSIGLGYSLFGKVFSESDEAIFYRNIFWNKDYEKLVELQPKMMPFFSKDNNKFKEFMKYLNFKGCHGLFFFNINNSLIFYANLFGDGQYPILTVITEKLDTYQHELINKYPDGWGYILVPQKERIIGEFAIPSLLAFNTGNKSFLPELAKLEDTFKEMHELPPFDTTMGKTNNTLEEK